MRFLHTSDWHLGRSIHSHSLASAQEAALDFIATTAIERRVDAVVIAGDVFDRAFPSVEDIRRLNLTLTRIHEAGIPIIITAGNHDDGGRLAAYRGLLDHQVHVIGEYHQVGTAIELRDEHGPVIFYPLPYLDPDAARRALAPDPSALLERSHEAVMAEALRRIRDDLALRKTSDSSVRSVVIAHAFVVTGVETPEELRNEQSQSERDISVGGVPSIPSGVFREIDYVALGHLHGPRQIGSGESPAIHYSGSILRYSMSEMNHVKSISIVHMDQTGATTRELLPVPQPRGMARLTGTVEELCSDAHAQHRDDFVELLVTDSRPLENYQAQLRQKFSHILEVKLSRTPSTLTLSAERENPVNLLTPLETLCNFYRFSTRKEPTDSIVHILSDALDQARKTVA